MSLDELIAIGKQSLLHPPKCRERAVNGTVTALVVARHTNAAVTKLTHHNAGGVWKATFVGNNMRKLVSQQDPTTKWYESSAAASVVVPTT